MVVWQQRFRLQPPEARQYSNGLPRFSILVVVVLLKRKSRENPLLQIPRELRRVPVKVKGKGAGKGGKWWIQSEENFQTLPKSPFTATVCTNIGRGFRPCQSCLKTIENGHDEVAVVPGEWCSGQIGVWPGGRDGSIRYCGLQTTTKSYFLKH